MLCKNMRSEATTPNDILELLEKNIIMTVDEIATKCSCSRRTVFQKLQKHDYITSYNKNKRFLALRKNIEFNENGIGTYKYVKFTIWGNVKKTIIALIDKSLNGYTAGEINNLLEIRTNKQLSELVRSGGIIRLKEGRNQYYFSKAIDTQRKQIDLMTQKQMEKHSDTATLSKNTVIKILVTIINEREMDSNRLQKLLHQQGTKVSVELIELVNLTYNIKKNS